MTTDATAAAATVGSPVSSDVSFKNEQRIGLQFAIERHTLTRGEVATRLGISTSSCVASKAPSYHPAQDDRGVWRFDPAELPATPSSPRRPTRRTRRTRSAGDTAAQVFRMLERGHDLCEIVIAARQPPQRVRQLYREWRIGLEQGERDRQARVRHAQQRREQAEDERAHREWMKVLGQ